MAFGSLADRSLSHPAIAVTAQVPTSGSYHAQRVSHLSHVLDGLPMPLIGHRLDVMYAVFKFILQISPRQYIDFPSQNAGRNGGIRYAAILQPSRERASFEAPDLSEPLPPQTHLAHHLRAWNLEHQC